MRRYFRPLCDVIWGVNFTIILWAAFAPVDLRPTYWRTAQSVQRKSWADFLVLWTSRVGRSFVGETEQHLFVPSAVHRRICALRLWVGEIDPWQSTCLFQIKSINMTWQVASNFFYSVYFEIQLRRVYTRRFNFLTHAFLFSNRKIPNQNVPHCCAFLPWLSKTTLVWPRWLWKRMRFPHA